MTTTKVSLPTLAHAQVNKSSTEHRKLQTHGKEPSELPVEPSTKKSPHGTTLTTNGTPLLSSGNTDLLVTYLVTSGSETLMELGRYCPEMNHHTQKSGLDSSQHLMVTPNNKSNTSWTESTPIPTK